jgi:hypothetical protein
VLEGALSFNVHEEYFGMVGEEMVVQSGHTQAAFQRDEHREVNFVSNRTVSPMTIASLWCPGEGRPGSECHEGRYFPAID